MNRPSDIRLWRILEAYIRRRLDADGYVEVKTPQLLDATLWMQSGHWGKFRENMFVVPDEVPGTDDEKPVLSGKSDLMALIAGCRTLYSEDLQNGRRFESLEVVSPFA